MSKVLVHPDTAPAPLLRALDLRQVAWKAVADLNQAADLEPPDGWSAAVLSVDADLDTAMALARWLHTRENRDLPVLLLTPADRLARLAEHVEVFDDFCLMPFHPAELEARLDHLLLRVDAATDGDVISHGPLRLNVETYQAMIAGRTLDLTYMEYELLKYLASEPGKVFSREVLLSDVWGYDYYGGARTVDVHIRRLRAKFGEEHASMISTVRSVGYRLGEAKWGDETDSSE